jgi:hypothetical protein
MIITISSIRLKSLWKFFALSAYALQITRQLYKSKGMLKFKKTGLGKLHYTLTVWESEDDMKNFAYSSGSHMEFMKKSGEIASELATYTYSTNEIPDWKTAKKLLAEKGKFLNFNN